MTAVQLNAMNVELWQSIGAIADDESLMRRLTRYAKKLVKEKESDSTLMSEEEFFARVDEAKEQYERGEYTTQLPGESVTDMLKRCGYEI